jgi:hypothetical protein
MDEKWTPEEKEQWDLTQEFYVALDKLIRGMQLYQGKGSLVERLLEELMKRADKLLQRRDSTVKISPIGPICFDKPLSDDGKIAKYIFQMYRDGIRELTFQQGIDADDIRKFGQICNEDIAAMDDDIVTLMWQADFEHIQYYAVDSLGEQMDVSGQEDSDLLEQSDISISGDLDGEAMQFSSSDMRLLRSKDSVNWVQMCSAPISATLDVKPLVEQIDGLWPKERDYGRFLAIIVQLARQRKRDVPMVKDLFSSMALSGNVDSVCGLLSGLVGLCSKGVHEAKDILQELMNAEEVLKLKDVYATQHERLEPILKEMVLIPSFSADGLIALLQELPMGNARSTLQSVLLKSSVDMTSFYVQGLTDNDDGVVLESIEALGQLETVSSLEALYSCLSHSLSSIRLKSLQAINGRYTEGQAKQIGKILKDPESENRLLALQICQSIVDKEVGNIMLGVMRETTFSKRPMDEQQQFYEGLYKYPFPTTFQFLSNILKDKNIVRNKSVTMKQLWAVDVFAKIGTEDAKSILRGLKGNWFLASEVKQKIKEVV